MEEYLISQEQHKDGAYHLHGYFKFYEKLDTTNPRYFDVSYYNINRHPNIQKPKTRYRLFDYIKKEGNFITNIEETRAFWRTLYEDQQNKEDLLFSMMTRIGNITSYSGYRTFMDLIKERDIRLSNSYHQLKNNELKNKLRHQQRRSYN